MHEDIVLQQPAHPDRLILLVRSGTDAAETLIALGAAIARQQPAAAVAVLVAPSVEALPRIAAAAGEWHARTGLDAARTVLFGIGAGAGLTLSETMTHSPTMGSDTKQERRTVIAVDRLIDLAATRRLKEMIDLVVRHSPDQGQPAGYERALMTVATMVGALVLARAVDDPKLSDGVREAALNHLTR